MQLTWIDFVVFGSFMAIVMAIASYEWMSAITLVIVAWWFLPKFLKAGIYTIYGGLKAVVWSDLLQDGALLIGGAIVAILFQKMGT